MFQADYESCVFYIICYQANAWEHMIAAREADPVFREVRENLMIVPPEFMQKLDCYEMQLE
jgi:hypothetical protein